MSVLNVHLVDYLILGIYFLLVLYLGVFLGAKKTATLGDFFVAGGRWGPLVSFVFVFASAIAGNEAVVVSGESYRSGLSGVWYWWSFLFATPVYFLFSTYYRRARVYSLADFLAMRYDNRVAGLYALVAGVICILFIGMFVLAIGKLLAGFTGLPIQLWVWVISIVVAAYVYSGGMMSALLTDLLQGVMCLFILGFIMLPFVWSEAGGLEALRALPDDTWNFFSPGMNVWTVAALNVSALVGGIAAPWIYNWIAVSKDEKTATQCAWGHLWKRVITLVFALYGIFFCILQPGLEDAELAWGAVMRDVLPQGYGLIGLTLASFFAAAMSSADTYATTSSAMFIDFIYRRVLQPAASLSHYLSMARLWAVVSIVIAAISTRYIDSIADYVKMSLSLLSFLGIPIYFGVMWRRSNVLGTWLSLLLGVTSYLTIRILPVWAGQEIALDENAVFVLSVFVPTALAISGMWIGSLLGAKQSSLQLDRFYLIMNTPIGEEDRLVLAGISLPALVDTNLVAPGPEILKPEAIAELKRQDAGRKIFGANSSVEIRRERLSWYLPGFCSITMGCVTLVLAAWLITRVFFVWN